MEVLLNILLVLVSFFAGQSLPSAASDRTTSEEATVVEVIDGDTIVVSLDGRRETVRYIGIDTPEPYRDGEPACYSAEATERNTALVAGSTVVLESDHEDRDRFGRLLRYVYVDDVLVNQQLVAEGFATTLTIKPNTNYVDQLAAAQESAVAQDLGLWSACDRR